jgi:hypothetical protein
LHLSFSPRTASPFQRIYASGIRYCADQGYWAAQKRGEIRYGDNKLPHLNIKVSKDTLPRAFRLLQALFAALETRGHKIAANQGR